MRPCGKLFMALLSVSTFAGAARAEWPNHAINLPVWIAPGYQSYPTIVSDGAAGSIIVWNEGPGTRAHKILADGTFGWDSAAVLCTSCTQGLLTAVTDVSGGAYVLSGRHNDSNGKTYIHHVSADGAALWSVTESSAIDPEIAADGSGGALVVWENSNTTSGTGVNIWAQRFDESGSIWRVNVSGDAPYGHELEPCVAADGSGGAFVAWEAADIRVQRLDASGNKLWSEYGVSAGSGRTPQIVADPVGGAMVAWGNNMSPWVTWVRRVNSLGVPIGLGPIEVTPLMTVAHVIRASDGGMILVGETATHQPPYYGRVLAQRIQPDGQVFWGPEGVEIVVAEAPDLTYDVAPDGSGGIVVTYSDGSGVFNVFAQRVSADGEKLWGENGVVVSSAGGNQKNPAGMIPSGTDYAIVTWDDNRNGNSDIYAQRVDGTPSVSVDVVEEGGPSLSLGPNPFRAQLNIQLSSARAGVLRGALFDVRGRRVAESTWNISRGASVTRWNLRDGAAPLDPGVYFVRLSTDSWRRDFRVVHIR